jgi:hypothetical protein
LQGFPHNDALVIEANIASWTLGKLLVDNGSSAEIIFADTFDKMGLSKDLLQPPDTPLYGFRGQVIHALGKVVIPVSFGTVQNASTKYLSFDVVEMYYPHQAYLYVKIPATQGVITIWGHQNGGRNLERGRTSGQRNVHALDEAVKGKEVQKQPKADREKLTCNHIVTPRGSFWTQWLWTKPSSLDRTSRQTKRADWFSSFKRTKTCSLGLPKILLAWTEVSLSTD